MTWLWGGFSVDNPTLNRFFSLHYLMPFMITGVVFLHIVALHITGSNNPLGIDIKSPQDTLPFHPYYTAKDSIGICVFLLVFAGVVFFAPHFFNHPDNYIPANPLVTPAHIVPEWYFLPFYAILRAVPDKLGGVILMFSSIAILFVLPWLDTSPVRSARFRPIYKQLILVFAAVFILLGVAGAKPPEGIWVVIGRVSAAGCGGCVSPRFHRMPMPGAVAPVASFASASSDASASSFSSVSGAGAKAGVSAGRPKCHP